MSGTQTGHTCVRPRDAAEGRSASHSDVRTYACELDALYTLHLTCPSSIWGPCIRLFIYVLEWTCRLRGSRRA